MRRVLVPVLTVALALSTCDVDGSGSGGGSGEVGRGGTLHVLSDVPDIDLDPARSQDLAVTAQGLIGRKLTTWQVEPGQEPKVVPDLATDTGKPSDGGRTWTYQLRDGVEFADGTPVTAADVKHGVERSFAPELSGGPTYHKSLLRGGRKYDGPYQDEHLDSVETKGDDTIVFHLKVPYRDWPWIVSMPAFTPVPEDEDDPDTYGHAPVATGPYQVETYQQGSSITLKRNENWDARTDPVRTAGPEKIVFTMNQQRAVTARELIADSGDDRNAFGASFVPPAQLTQARRDAGARKRLTVSAPGALTFLAMNTERPPLKNVEARKAIEYAVDKLAFQEATGGPLGGELASTLVTPGIPGRVEYDKYETGGHGDVAKAKRLLADAGRKGGLKLKLVVANDPETLAEAHAIQQGLKRAGIVASLQPLDSDAFREAVTGDEGDYDLAYLSWQPDFPRANANISPLFASSEIGGGGYNVSRYSDARVDELIDRAAAETDPVKAQRLWAKADKRIMRDAPVVPLTYRRNAFLRGSNVRTFEVAPFPGYPNYPRVSLAQ